MDTLVASRDSDRDRSRVEGLDAREFIGIQTNAPRVMESVVLVVDVRSTTADSPGDDDMLEHAVRAAQTFAHEKLVHKPTHEVGLVVFGSATANNDRMGGDGSKYDHVYGFGGP
jgi:hypothetical protein